MENQRDIEDVFFEIVELRVLLEFEEKIKAGNHFMVKVKENGAMIYLNHFDKSKMERSLYAFLDLLHRESSKLSYEALESELEQIREKLNLKNKDE